MEISIIIVSYNTKDKLSSLLRSLTDAGIGLDWQVIVVDNASTDGTVKMLEQQFPDVILVKNNRNLGFARACNIGFAKSNGRFLFFLNPDTEIKPQVVEKLVEFASYHADCGIVAPQLLNGDGSPQASVRNLPTLWRAIRQYWLGQLGVYDFYLPGGAAVSVESVTGAAMLIHRNIFEKVGGFDERYFMYFEDLELCRQVISLGYKIYYLPQLTIVHHKGASAQTIGGKAFQMLKISSKIYHGWAQAFLIDVVIRSGRICKKLLGRNTK
ncbi:glycosyltransferase family 2 protein [Candidatus Daviesbacteria bacterium]|nr:glycosyltransferase family 2 protein [Candidatus Daviesbacteria bacterium]